MWQRLHDEFAGRGLTVVTVALDVEPTNAYAWIDAHPLTHPTLIDQAHVTDELFGFVNVPMAVWINEDGVIVRPAELASVEESALRNAPIPDGLPDRMKAMFAEVKKLGGQPVEYHNAITDWVQRGAASRFALAPDEVIARSQPRAPEHARAAAAFELGQFLWHTEGHEAAVPWWREAHRLFPENWTYKRQAWTFVTTPPGAAPDLIQGPNDVYEGNWLDDVLRQGGGEKYYPPLQL